MDGAGAVTPGASLPRAPGLRPVARAGSPRRSSAARLGTISCCRRRRCAAPRAGRGHPQPARRLRRLGVRAAHQRRHRRQGAVRRRVGHRQDDGGRRIARELGLDLYRIDLSGVVSKYIGETEKNLDRIFRAARAANAIAVPRRSRSAVRQALARSRTRTTATPTSRSPTSCRSSRSTTASSSSRPTCKRNIDDAFTRRMHYVVEFPAARRGAARAALARHVPAAGAARRGRRLRVPRAAVRSRRRRHPQRRARRRVPRGAGRRRDRHALRSWRRWRASSPSRARRRRPRTSGSTSDCLATRALAFRRRDAAMTAAAKASSGADGGRDAKVTAAQSLHFGHAPSEALPRRNSRSTEPATSRSSACLLRTPLRPSSLSANRVMPMNLPITCWLSLDAD